MKLSFELKSLVWILILIWLSGFLVPASSESRYIESSEIGMLVKGNHSFCFDLYRQLKKEEGNIFFSPYSLSTALAMTYAGARGITEKEMAKVLHFTLPQKKLHPVFFELASSIKKSQERGDVESSIANALWIQKDFRLKKDFLSITDMYYGAAPFLVDFIPDDARERTRKKINLWVENKTREKVKDLIPEGILTYLTRLVLTNAIYFKADWMTQFNESHTRNAPFWLSQEKKVDVPMMFLESSFRYMEDGYIQVLQMPYKGKQISMLIILPEKDFGMKKLERELNSNRLDDWSARLRQRKVKVYFPKFKMTCKYEMKKTLTAMGMGNAFSDSADFSGMSEEPLLIEEVLHKAFLEIDEEGTEAAAATAVVMKKRGPTRAIIPVFRADHPFIILIKDNRTGSILFMGRVSDPS